MLYAEYAAAREWEGTKRVQVWIEKPDIFLQEPPLFAWTPASCEPDCELDGYDLFACRWEEDGSLTCQLYGTAPTPEVTLREFQWFTRCRALGVERAYLAVQGFAGNVKGRMSVATDQAWGLKR
jgi:hypothetical protein